MHRPYRDLRQLLLPHCAELDAMLVLGVPHVQGPVDLRVLHRQRAADAERRLKRPGRGTGGAASVSAGMTSASTRLRGLSTPTAGQCKMKKGKIVYTEVRRAFHVMSKKYFEGILSTCI